MIILLNFLVRQSQRRGQGLLLNVSVLPLLLNSSAPFLVVLRLILRAGRLRRVMKRRCQWFQSPTRRIPRLVTLDVRGDGLSPPKRRGTMIMRVISGRRTLMRAKLAKKLKPIPMS